MIRPLGDRIVVRADEFQETTASGIFIATAEDKSTDTGEVVAVGPEVSGINAEDDVLFLKGAGETLEILGDQLTVLTLNEVVGVLDQTSALSPVADVIVCTDAEFGDQQTQAGIIIKSNINQSQGITSRWMRVHKVGPEQELVKAGQWVLVEYGRWTAGFTVDGFDEAYRVDPLGCIAVSDEKPDNTVYYNSDVVTADKKAAF